MKKLRIGLFGFGTVGEGIYQVLASKPEMRCEIVKICIRDQKKVRNAPAHLFTDDPKVILEDTTIDVVIELIDDSGAAFKIVMEALKAGKAVISANKKMISENHVALVAAQQEYKSAFLYEAAVCGSIPILRNLEDYFDNDSLNYVTGIVNGSTNYMLTQMAEGGITFEESLSQAQADGFAESNPTYDVEGIDASFKLSIICLHAFGKIVEAQAILRKGISSIRPIDLEFARERDLTIKLVATSENSNQLQSFIFPTFLEKHSALSAVHNEYNGVLIGSSLADKQFLSGKGAGRYPTSSAVLSDLSSLRHGYKYKFRKGRQKEEQRVLGTKKFYLSFNSTNEIDLAIFDRVLEQRTSNDFSYVVGVIPLATLKKNDFWKDPDVSIIAFE